MLNYSEEAGADWEKPELPGKTIDDPTLTLSLPLVWQFGISYTMHGSPV